MVTPPDLSSLRASLYLSGTLLLRSTADGGRHTPIWTGYRSDASLGPVVDLLQPGAASLHSCRVDFAGDAIEPGADRLARIVPSHPEYWRSISAGAKIGLHEGPRRIATFAVATGIDGEALDVYLAAIEADRSRPIPDLSVPAIDFIK
jgi:hypothetical protein